MNFIFYIPLLFAFFTCQETIYKPVYDGESMSSTICRYDANHTRIRLVKTNPGTIMTDFLFIPGGPGVDSSSLMGLVDQINLPGNYFLVDFIFNGTNKNYPNSDDVYELWPQYLEELVGQFEHPVLIGHSFGGYLPLFCPALEKLLKGLIIFNSIPTLNSDLFAKTAIEQNLPSLASATTNFIRTPNLENMKALYLLEADYFFVWNQREKGIQEILNKLEFCIPTEHWWYREGFKFYAEIKWIPQKVPTLIIGGLEDFITPPAIFEQAVDFQRENIQMVTIPSAGHFPWLEQPNLVSHATEIFLKSVISNDRNL